MDVVATLADHAQLVAGLEAALAPQGLVRRIETHISTVLLAGDHAYKLKKPVALGFLDFSSREARRHFCEEELRLNRRTAPALYLDVVDITGTLQAPRLGGAAPVIDSALRMQRFDETRVLDRLAARGELGLELMQPLAQAVERLHRVAERADVRGRFGTLAVVRHWIDSTAQSLREHALAPQDRERIDTLAQWCDRTLARRAPLIEARRLAGAVREGHGDLHLGNVVLHRGQPVLFDALEFNAELRIIDVVNDLAFLWMDLLDHALPVHATRVLNAWLQISGDYAGLPLLRCYAVYRALVRARVAQIRAQQPAVPVQGRVREQTSAEHYLLLAGRLAGPPPPTLVVMTGLSGSGKSTVAALLADRMGAVWVRSDVERKRLYGVDWQAGAPADPQNLYSPEATQRTYARLIEAAHAALDGGLSVVVDAASLRAAERRALLAVAAAANVPGAIVECTAPEAVLRERVLARGRQGSDPSDATVAVLASQLRWREPSAGDEQACLHRIDTALSLAQVAARCDALVRQLAGGTMT